MKKMYHIFSIPIYFTFSIGFIFLIAGGVYGFFKWLDVGVPAVGILTAVGLILGIVAMVILSIMLFEYIDDYPDTKRTFLGRYLLVCSDISDNFLMWKAERVRIQAESKASKDITSWIEN